MRFVYALASVSTLLLLSCEFGEAEARRGRGRAAKLFSDEASLDQSIADDIGDVDDNDHALDQRNNADRGYNRDKRVIGIFNVFRFENGPCNQTNGEGGVCYSESECAALGGTNGGSCASPVGVCCGFSVTCGQTSSQNCTYFSSTDADTSPCTATICPSTSNICQLRLDFVSFDIAQPVSGTVDTTGIFSAITQCQGAQFTATSEADAAPTICGTNTGQHMIVEADPSCNQLSFSWTTATPRTWRIKVNQISCFDPNKPPEGCTQYFTGTTGNIQSYNFAGGIHLANQNYENCIRTEENFCTIQYSANTATDPSSFQIAVDSSDPAVATGEQCTLDYVFIPFSYAAADAGVMKPNADRYCGNNLRDPNTGDALTIFSVQRPFVVGFRTNAGEGLGSTAPLNTLDTLPLGFSIDYTQTMCT